MMTNLNTPCFDQKACMQTLKEVVLLIAPSLEFSLAQDLACVHPDYLQDLVDHLVAIGLVDRLDLVDRQVLLEDLLDPVGLDLMVGPVALQDPADPLALQDPADQDLLVGQDPADLDQVDLVPVDLHPINPFSSTSFKQCILILTIANEH